MTLASPLTDTGRGISTKHRISITFRTPLFSPPLMVLDYHEELAPIVARLQSLS